MKTKIINALIFSAFFAILLALTHKSRIQRAIINEKNLHALDEETQTEIADIYLKNSLNHQKIKAMDELLEAEDLYNKNKLAESQNLVKEIDRKILTPRAKSWLTDLENELRKCSML